MIALKVVHFFEYVLTLGLEVVTLPLVLVQLMCRDLDFFVVLLYEFNCLESREIILNLLKFDDTLISSVLGKLFLLLKANPKFVASDVIITFIERLLEIDTISLKEQRCSLFWNNFLNFIENNNANTNVAVLEDLIRSICNFIFSSSYSVIFKKIIDWFSLIDKFLFSAKQFNRKIAYSILKLVFVGDSSLNFSLFIYILEKIRNIDSDISYDYYFLCLSDIAQNKYYQIMFQPYLNTLISFLNFPLKSWSNLIVLTLLRLTNEPSILRDLVSNDHLINGLLQAFPVDKHHLYRFFCFCYLVLKF